MPQERLPVRKIREVLRLKNEGFSNRAIARVCKVSNSTVGEYLEKARQAGLSWPLPEGLSEETLVQSLFLEKGTSSQPIALRAPDWEEVYRELSKRDVSLRLLWHIVPISFGRNIVRRTRTDMGRHNLVSIISDGIKRIPIRCDCRIRAAKKWRWITPG